MNELWMDIAGHEGKYQVSDEGRVRRVVNGYVLHATDSNGYLAVWLYPLQGCRKQGKKHFVHRLVALAFCPNPDKVNIVNHIDRDRKNNRSVNLEWLSPSGNTQHWMEHDRQKEAKHNSDMPF